jgi:hypothetical protein
MITPELQTYIRQQIGAGITKEVIMQNLSAKGWNVQDVNDTFLAIESEQSTQAATPPVASTSHKGMWATVIILLLLFLGAGGAYAAYAYGLFASPAPTLIPVATTTESVLPVATTETATSTVSTTTPEMSGIVSTTTSTTTATATTTEGH